MISDPYLDALRDYDATVMAARANLENVLRRLIAGEWGEAEAGTVPTSEPFHQPAEGERAMSEGEPSGSTPARTPPPVKRQVAAQVPKPADGDAPTIRRVKRETWVCGRDGQEFSRKGWYQRHMAEHARKDAEEKKPAPFRQHSPAVETAGRQAVGP